MKFLKIIILIEIILSTFSTSILYAEAPVRGINEYTPRELVGHFARMYNVSEAQMSKTIQCESNWNPNEVGDNGHSFGLVQIYLPAHKDISKEQALDLVYSIEFMAKHFKSDKRMWTCWRLLYEKHP